ncbi:ELMO/CED-12 family-domain-containing protein [Dipodascopsis tothii]|uniref:ELMO/CED-12 family-domain-containing protein n=1 Tax=Dipodascopsis tothii TaxID=44089 RepID=UPI0034CE4301
MAHIRDRPVSLGNPVVIFFQTIGDAVSRYLVGSRLCSEAAGGRAPTQSRFRSILFTIVFHGYKSWKRILRLLFGVTTIDRLARIGFLAELRNSRTETIEVLMVRRAQWLIDCELILSRELAPERRQIEAFGSGGDASTTGSGDEADEYKTEAQAIAKQICRKKQISLVGDISFAYLFLTKTVMRILYVERVLYETVKLSEKEVKWNDEVERILVETYDCVQARATELRMPLPAAKPELDYRGGRNWVALGFQGANPADDFRGSGLLGMIAFRYLCTKYTTRSVQIMYESHSAEDVVDMVSTPWYSAALASIHITVMLTRLITAGQLRMWMLLCLDDDVREQDMWDLVLALHAHLLSRFHTFWMAQVKDGKVRSVMDFETCFEAYATTVPGDLAQFPSMYALFRQGHGIDHLCGSLGHSVWQIDAYFEINALPFQRARAQPPTKVAAPAEAASSGPGEAIELTDIKKKE